MQLSAVQAAGAGGCDHQSHGLATCIILTCSGYCITTRNDPHVIFMNDTRPVKFTCSNHLLCPGQRPGSAASAGFPELRDKDLFMVFQSSTGIMVPANYDC